MRTGPKTSKKSEKIIEFIKQGIPLKTIARKGYSLSTVRYYNRKLNHPEKFEKYMGQVKFYNNRRKSLVK